MIPHTFVLEPGLRIFKLYDGYWFWGRPSPWELWIDLRAVGARIRPDWVLGGPELQASWEGDKTLHHPYRRRCSSCSCLMDGLAMMFRLETLEGDRP